MHDTFNPATYQVIDVVTGEVVDMAIFIEKVEKSGWEKAYAKTLADYINCAGDKSSMLLAWIISNREKGNLIHGTQAEIADMSKVSLPVVKRVMRKLVEKDFIRKIRSGTYMVTPKMIRNGNNVMGAIMVRTWYDAS